MTKQVIINRSFMLYLIGQTISSMGDGLYLIAFMWLSVRISNDTGLALGGAFSIYSLGEILSGFISGPIVDRIDNRRLLIYVDLARSSVVMMLYITVIIGIVTLAQLYCCIFLFSILSPFFHRAEFAVLPKIVSSNDLTKANGLLFGSKRLVRILSPVIAGLIIQISGITTCFLCDVFSYVASLICILCIDLRYCRKRTQKFKFRFLMQDMKCGCRIILRSSYFMTIGIYAACINFIGAPIFPLLPLISKRVFGGVSGYGLLMSSLSAGLVVSSFLMVFLSKLLKKIRIMLGGLILCAIALMVVAIGRAFYVFIISCFLMGIGLNLANLPIQIVLQQRVSKERLGVVSGSIYTMAQIAMPISMGLSGFLMKIVTIETIFFVAGTSMLFGAILGFYLPQFRCDTNMIKRRLNREEKTSIEKKRGF